MAFENARARAETNVTHTGSKGRTHRLRLAHTLADVLRCAGLEAARGARRENVQTLQHLSRARASIKE